VVRDANSGAGAGQGGPPLPLLDLARQHGPLRDELRAAVDRVLDGGAFVGGPEVEAFEAEFAAWHGGGGRRCVGVGNGTDAIAVALRALGIGAGDEVVTTAVSFFATAEAVGMAGATPVFCDVDPATANLDAALLDGLVTPRTRAVVPVHLYGQPCDMDGVLAVARRRGLAVVEDCAQAAGAAWRGRKVGTIGDLGCFSFYPSKNLGALGDAGAILTADAGLAARCRRLANHGGLRKYEHAVVGANSRLDAVQAAALRVKLPRLEGWNAQRAALAARYRERLAGLPVEPLATAPGAGHAHHLFVVRVPGRDGVLAALRRAGVMADVHYPEPIPFVPAYAGLGLDPASFPRARAHAAACLSLPLFPGMRDDEVDRVVSALAACPAP
jgi:dTDP-4-amino-4,6-dideoxygalactose transaminase